MTTLITGGAGFIGSHLVEKLLSEGHEVVCLENFGTLYDPTIRMENIRRAWALKNFMLIEGNIRDTSALERSFEGKQIDLVVHLAARAGVPPSIQQPELYYDVNVSGILRLLEAMRLFGARKMVFGSSSPVYGNSFKVPFSESDPVDNPISPHAARKKAGELLCHRYHHLYGFDIFCLRSFTDHGPRQRPEMLFISSLRISSMASLSQCMAAEQQRRIILLSMISCRVFWLQCRSCMGLKL